MARTSDINKHSAILEAAIIEFERYGYKGANIDQIAKRAKVVKGTVYKHFKCKNTLFMELVDDYVKRYSNLHKVEYLGTIDFKEQLAGFIRNKLLFYTDAKNIKLTHIIFGVMLKNSSITNDVKNIIHEVYDEAFKNLSQFFLDAKEDKKLDFDDVAIVIHMFIGHMKSFAFYPQMYGTPPLTPENIDKIVEASVEIIQTLYIGKKNVT